MESELRGLPGSVPHALAARTEHPDDCFVISARGGLTFGEADQQSRAFAGQLLAAGVGKGTRIGILHPNGPAWALAWLAAARIGALTVPLSTFAPGGELARSLRHGDVHGLLMGERFTDQSLADRLVTGIEDLGSSAPELALPQVPYLRWIHVDGASPCWSTALPPPLAMAVVDAAEAEVRPSDALAMISTSGATATPKAVVHTQGSLVRHAALLAHRRGLDRRDRIYSPMPFFWVGGLTMVLLAALCSGATAVVQERFDAAEALELAEREGVTQISCWPNAAREMAEHPTFATRDLSAVRGGTLIEALPADRRPASADLAPIPLGMTETGGPHTGPDDAYVPLPPELRGTLGRSLPGMEHRIVDLQDGHELGLEAEGEILVRGRFLMDGLYKRERHEVFTPDGWYPTGDLGWFGSDEHLRFTGRRGAMVKTGGSNVSPAEVEAALAELPGIRTAYVFGVPSGDRGEDVAAVLVPAAGQQIDVTAVTAAARTTLSSYKVPRQFRIVAESELPMLPTGKADLAALRALFAAPPG